MDVVQDLAEAELQTARIAELMARKRELTVFQATSYAQMAIAMMASGTLTLVILTFVEGKDTDITGLLGCVCVMIAIGLYMRGRSLIAGVEK